MTGEQIDMEDFIVDQQFSEMREKVAQFTETFGLLNKTTEFWVGLCDEELQEWVEEFPSGDVFADPSEAELKEACDVLYVVSGYINAGGTSKYYYNAALNMLDTYDNIEQAFNRVHKSNMSKVGADGLPEYNTAGKVMKGPNYKKPDLGDLV